MRSGGNVSVATILAIALVLPWSAARPAPAFDSANFVRSLAGRWAGNGGIKWMSGHTDPFKCVTTYFVRNEGKQVTQNFRCNGKSRTIGDGTAIRIELTAEWNVDGAAITGTWHEKIYEFKGTFSGKLTPNRIELDIRSDYVTAEAKLNVTGCDADVVLSFSEEIDEVTAKGRKDGCAGDRNAADPPPPS